MDILSRICLMTIFTLSVALTSLVQVEAQEECVLTKPDGGVVDWDWGIDLTIPDTTAADAEFYSLGNEGFIEPKFIGDYPNYFSVVTTEGGLSLRVSSEFPKIEESLSALNTLLLLPLNVKCGTSTKKLDFKVTLTDTNNHFPNFTLTENFVYELPMPFPGNFELSNCLGNELSATDHDITNSAITFEVGGGGEEYFTITSAKDAQDQLGKRYKGILKTSKELRFEKEMSFTITSTDAGTPETKSDRRNIIVKPILEASSIKPKFKQPLYTEIIIEETDVLQIEMEIVEGYEKEDLTISIENGGTSGVDPVPYFTHVREDNVVTLTWNTGADLGGLLKEPFALLVINVQNSRSEELSGATVIHITLPGAIPPTTTTSAPTTTPEPCPTTPIPTTLTDCPVCLTTPIPTTLTDCPICLTTPIPTTLTDCPVCLTTPIPTAPPTCPAPTTLPSTECPTCPDPTTLPSTECPTCPDPTTLPSTECPTYPDPTTLPSTECPTDTTTTECDCTNTPPTDCPTSDPSSPTGESTDQTPSVTVCPTFDPTTMCPETTTECSSPGTSDGQSEDTTTNTGASDSTNSDPALTSTVTTPEGTPGESTTDVTACPTFDPTTMCPTVEASTGTTLEGNPTGSGESTTPSDGCVTACPTFDPSTMCPTVEASTGTTLEGNPTGNGESTTPSDGSVTACPTFDPSTMCPTIETSTGTGKPPSSTSEPCECSSTLTNNPSDETSSSVVSGETPPIGPTDPTLSSTSSSTDPELSSTATDSSSPTEPGSTNTNPSTEDPGESGSTGHSSSTDPELSSTPTDSSSPTEPGSTNTNPSTDDPGESGSTGPSSSAEPGGTTDPEGEGSTGTGTEGSTTQDGCDECPSTTPSTCEPAVTPSCPAPGELEFKEANYVTTIPCSYTGTLQDVELELEGEFEDAVYNIYVESGDSFVSIDKKTAELHVTATLNAGVHVYLITVRVGGSLASTKLEVEVLDEPSCVAGLQGFKYTLSVVNVTEQTSPQVLLDGKTQAQGSDCTYSLEVDNDAVKDNFMVFKDNGTVMVTKDLDRESPEFNGETNPTIKLTLTTECKTKVNTQVQIESPNQPWEHSDRQKRNSDWSSVVEEILNDEKVMVIVVVIQDLNDNVPKFGAESITIGYPAESISQQVLPASLTTVKATDADIGINAKIRYSLNDAGDKSFLVHPQTGVIYPRQDTFDYKDTSFMVIATDLDGASDGLKEELLVNVRILTLDTLVVLSVSGAVVEDTEGILTLLSTRATYSVHSLSSTVVASAEQTRSRKKRDIESIEDVDDDDDTNTSGIVLRLVLYAFDAQSNTVHNEQLMEKLKQSMETEDWKVSSMRALELNDGGSGGDSDVSGLMAAVIALAVLMILVLGAVGALYYLFVYRPNKSTSTSKQQLLESEITNEEDSSLTSVVPTKPYSTDGLLIKGAEVEPETPKNRVTLLFSESETASTETADYMEPISTPIYIEPISTPEYIEPTSETSVIYDDIGSPPASKSSEYLLAAPVLPPARKRSFTIRDEFDDRRDELNQSDDSVLDESNGKSDEDGNTARMRKKSVVTFNDNVDCIEIERL